MQKFEWYYCDMAEEMIDGAVNRAGVIFNFLMTAFVYISALLLLVCILVSIYMCIFEGTKIGRACVHHWKCWDKKNRFMLYVKNKIRGNI